MPLEQLIYPTRHLIVRSRKVSEQRDLYLEMYGRSEIWQHLGSSAAEVLVKISKRCDNLNYESRGFESLRDLTIRRLIGYWNGVSTLSTNIECLNKFVKEWRAVAQMGWNYFGVLKQSNCMKHGKLPPDSLPNMQPRSGPPPHSTGAGRESGGKPFAWFIPLNCLCSPK